MFVATGYKASHKRWVSFFFFSKKFQCQYITSSNSLLTSRHRISSYVRKSSWYFHFYTCFAFTKANITTSRCETVVTLHLSLEYDCFIIFFEIISKNIGLVEALLPDSDIKGYKTTAILDSETVRRRSKKHTKTVVVIHPKGLHWDFENRSDIRFFTQHPASLNTCTWGLRLRSRTAFCMLHSLASAAVNRSHTVSF